jgi:hypothetical protein
MGIERLVTTTTRIAAGLAGALAVVGAVWQLRQGTPVQEMHIPLHTNVLFAPIGFSPAPLWCSLRCHRAGGGEGSSFRVRYHFERPIR